MGNGRFDGRKALITGGGGGVGRATALRLAAEGASVAVLDRRSDDAQKAAMAVEEAGGTAIALTCDVTSELSVRSQIATAVEALGGLDVVHVNHATLSMGRLHELSLDDWNQVIQVNLTGAFLVLREVLPVLVAGGGGAVVTTGSIEAVGIHTRSPASASYPASKGGLLMLTRAIAVEYAEHGIRANCVCPGAVRTNIMANIAADFPGTPERDHWKPPLPFQCPDDEPSSPEDIAAAVAYLASDDARKVTGTTLMVDGGWSAI